jgi:hypothetical protein
VEEEKKYRSRIGRLLFSCSYGNQKRDGGRRSEAENSCVEIDTQRSR